MNKIWFIWIDGMKEGPYNAIDLKRDPRITPDTLVWKEGFKEWKAIRHVGELKEIFKDKPESKPLHENTPLPIGKGAPEEEALTLQNDPFQFYLWLLVIVLITLYLFYQINKFT